MCDKSNSIDKFIEDLNKNKKVNEVYTYLNSVGAAKGITEKIQFSIYKKFFLKTHKELDKDKIFESEIHCFNFYPLGASKQQEYPYSIIIALDLSSKKNLNCTSILMRKLPVTKF